MMTGQNIVCFANDWDSDPTSKHQLMKILAQENRVLWVNSIGLRRPALTGYDTSRIIRKMRQFWKGPVAVNHNMHVITPVCLPFHDVPALSAVNARWVGRYVLAQARKLGMDRFQVWTFLPTTAPVIRHLIPEKVVYYCVDEWSEFSFLNGGLMQEMEESLIHQSDLVITSAEKLYESKRHLNPRTYWVPHGVDSEHFAQARSENRELAREVKEMPKPIIGFWGLIHEWIDLALVRHVAECHPDWSLVLVGKINVDCSELEKLPNIHLVGPQSYESLPGFAKGFTAAILPFKVNRLTDNVNPIKLREYLAAGLPVVSTPLREVRRYSHLVRIGGTPEEFVRELEAAVHETGKAAAQVRMDAVSKETWLAKVEQISGLVSPRLGES